MTSTDSAALWLAAIVASSDDAIISHTSEGTIETWNLAAERIFGYTAAEAIGLPVQTLVAPDCVEHEGRLMQRLRQRETIAHFESTALLKSGRTIPVSLSLSPVLTAAGEMVGISRIVRDMSLQRRIERDAQRLAAIVDSSEDAIISKDLSGIVQTWNAAAERMFGYAAAEMIGQSITRIIPADRLEEEDLVLTRIRAGLRVEHFETIRQRKDGSLVDISLSISPIRTESGAIVGASKIARDITAQRRLARQLEEANRVKDEFLATLSHELRTPLNAVLGYTRMLRTGKVAAEGQERAMEVIERNATLLHQLVSDVLDISGIVTGKIKVHPVACDVRTLVRAACESLQPTAETKGVHVTLVAPDGPVMTRCDPDRMQQVFWNLLANAVKFTPRDGTVAVRIDQRDHTATVDVSDTGIGISPEAMPHLFQRFWQGESVNSRQTGGLGLGLALARHFVELHGGTITASSPGAGKGATFIVSLPVPGH